MNTKQESPAVRSMLLRVISIIMFFSALTSVAVCLAGISVIRHAALITPDTNDSALPSLVILLIAAITEIFAGIWGFLNWKNPMYAGSCIALGIVIAAVIFIGGLLAASVSPAYFITAVTAPALPVLYMLGGIILKRNGIRNKQTYEEDPSLPLKVISIIMFIEALIFIAVCLICFVRISIGTSVFFDGEAIPPLIVLMVGAVVQIAAGVLGLLSCKRAEMIKTDMVLGAAVAALLFIGCFILATVEPTFMIYAFIGAVVPVVFMIGADILKHQQ